MQAFDLSGVIPPVVTPLSEGGSHLDVGALQAHVAWLIEKGVHALMPCGTTGEGPLLTTLERIEVLQRVVEVTQNRVPVIAHVGAITTGESIRLAIAAATDGAAAISIVSPYYFGIPDSAQVAHFYAVSREVSGLPVYLYNIPQCTGNSVTPNIVQEVVARSPNVLGIKDSSGQLEGLRELIRLDIPGFQVACGADPLVLHALKLGASASISGNANAFPEVVVELYRCYRSGDLPGAQRQQALLDVVRNALRNGQSIALIKRGLELRGLHGGAVRPPLPETSPADIEAARNALVIAGLLGRED